MSWQTGPFEGVGSNLSWILMLRCFCGVPRSVVLGLGFAVPLLRSEFVGYDFRLDWSWGSSMLVTFGRCRSRRQGCGGLASTLRVWGVGVSIVGA